MRRCLIPGLLAGLTVLSGCATPTPYGPVDGRYGYSETRIEEDRYRVTFQGNSLTDRETVETFLLYRAAELTLENGHDHFLVVEADTETERRYRTTGAPPPHVYGWYPYSAWRFPYYAYGWPWGYDTTIRETRRYEAHAFIQMRSGDKPEDEPRAYDARQVVENLGPAIRASQAEG